MRTQRNPASSPKGGNKWERKLPVTQARVNPTWEQEGASHDSQTHRHPTPPLLQALQQPLIVLPDVGLRPNLHMGHVAVLVQHVDVVVWGDADDGLFSCHGDS